VCRQDPRSVCRARRLCLCAFAHSLSLLSSSCCYLCTDSAAEAAASKRARLNIKIQQERSVSLENAAFRLCRVDGVPLASKDD
jgi:hypothetical protein